MLKFHKECRFGDGPRMPMDRERRSVWLARLKLFRRAGRLTPLMELIGCALIKRLGDSGQLDPAHATIAADVGCSTRSVQRALTAMRDCGLTVWVQRLTRAGNHVVQMSNSYVLTIGDSAPIPKPLLTRKSFLGVSQPACLPTVTAGEMRLAQAGLAAIAARRTAALFGGASTSFR